VQQLKSNQAAISCSPWTAADGGKNIIKMKTQHYQPMVGESGS
jgi:hypothetical protein